MAQQVKKKFIGNDQVDGSKILLEVGQTIRQQDGLGGEVDVLQSIDDSISNEQSRAEAAESALDGRLTTAEGEIDQLQSDVTSNLSAAQAYTDQKIADLVDSAPELLDTLNELAAALGDDPNFATTIATSVAGVQSSLDQEILDRQAADSDLQGQIDDEETRALAAEGVLQGNIDVVSSDLAQEVQDRIDADQLLQDNIDSVISDLDQEILDRQTLEGEFDAYVVSNDAALAQEIQDRIAAVSDEEQRALAAEGALQSQITQEISDRQAGDQALEDSKVAKSGDTMTGNLVIDKSALGNTSGFGLVLKSSNNSNEGLKVESFAPSSISENSTGTPSTGVSVDSRLESSGLYVKTVFDNGVTYDGGYQANFAWNGYTDSLGNYLPVIPTEPDQLTTKAYVDQEISALSSGGLAQVISDLAQEVQDRIDGDSNLQSQIDTEKGRIDAILDASQADKDSFAEIVALINSVDTENDTAFAGYVLSNDAALAQEVSDRQAGDTTLQSNIDTVSSNLSQEISDRQTLEGEFDAYVVSNDAALAQEVSDRTSADSNLQSQIDQVVSDLAQEVLDRQSDVDTEEQRALAAESVLQDNIDAEEAARIAAVQGLQDQIDALDTGFVTEAELASTVSSLQAEIDSDVAAEAALRDAADIVLQGNIDTVSSNLSQEISDRESADSVLQGNIDSEESARIAADDLLDGRVSVLESVVFFKEKFVLTATDISNGFVTLSHTPESNSMSAFVDRLAIHEGAGEDYSISGTTMTFLNDLVNPGQQALLPGDSIYVKYQYKM